MSGRAADVTGIGCNEDGIKFLEFSEPEGPTFKYDPPNDVSFGDQPLMSKYISVSELKDRIELSDKH